MKTKLRLRIKSLISQNIFTVFFHLTPTYTAREMMRDIKCIIDECCAEGIPLVAQLDVIE